MDFPVAERAPRSQPARASAHRTPTKGLVIVSTLLAAGLEAYVGSRAMASLWQLSLAAFVLGAVSGRLAWRLLPQLVLFLVYLSPAVFLTRLGFHHFSLDIVWIGALLGLVVCGRGGWQWSLPPPWPRSRATPSGARSTTTS